MARLVEMTSEKNEPHKCWPLLSCLNIESMVFLDAAIYYNHRKHILPPTPEIDILPFDTAKEMSLAPHPEGSQWRK